MEKSREEKIKTALEYYLSEASLKDLPRTGWLDWHVQRDRIESVAEHSHASQHLAYAIWSEFDIPVNIDRVIAMLAFHENEEPVIGDIPLVSDIKVYKTEIGKIAVTSILEKMARKQYAQSLITEFEERKTKEAKFARFIDKLECDLTSKLYDEEDAVDLNNQSDNASSLVPLVAKLLSEGKSFGEMWMEFGREVYGYPEEFESISEYAERTNLHELRDANLDKAKAKVKSFLNSVIKSTE